MISRNQSLSPVRTESEQFRFDSTRENGNKMSASKSKIDHVVVVDFAQDVKFEKALRMSDQVFCREMRSHAVNAESERMLKKRFDKNIKNFVSNWLKIYDNSTDEVYGTSYNYKDALNSILPVVVKAALKQTLRVENEDKIHYLTSNKRICATAYLDISCGALENIDDFIENLKTLNVDMVHLLPTLYPGPEGVDDKGKPIDDDGGYSINSHRAVNPRLGFLPGESTSPTLEKIFERFLKNGIRVIADFTINHLSDQSEYYKKWKANDPDFKEFYIAVDEKMRRDFDENMTSFFPSLRKGNFTYDQEMGKYIMSRFKNSQKDLNWRNPYVATKMFDDMFFLVNAGADLRLDATPVMFKKLGTSGINLPEVFQLIEALRSAMEIVAPEHFILAESINMPSMILPFLEKNRCDLAYNTAISSVNLPAVAAQDVTLLRDSLYYFVQESRPEGVWFNPERTHDDFLIKLDVRVAHENQVDTFKYNTEMHQFFTGKRSDSYATGYAFQSEPHLGQFSGTLASLMGLETALASHDQNALDLSMARINLTKATRYGLPGIPVVNYLGGDHVGSINNPNVTDDSREVHRIPYEKLKGITDPMHKICSDKIVKHEMHLTGMRKKLTAFSGKTMLLMDADSPQILSYNRQYGSDQCLVIGNYSNNDREIDLRKLRPYTPRHVEKYAENVGVDVDAYVDSFSTFSAAGFQYDVIRGEAIEDRLVRLKPYQAVWLTSKPFEF